MTRDNFLSKDSILRPLLALFALGMLVILLIPPRINQDSALYLQIGYRLLDGQTPYVDYFETNPPLIHYVSVVPVWISELARIPVITVFFTLVLLLATWSSWAAHRVLQLDAANAPEKQHTARIIALSAMLFAILVLLFTQYGQREHLFILVLLPAFALRYIRWQGRADGAPIPPWLAVIIGATAAVGVAFKPYFLIPVVLTELYWLARCRRLKPLLQPEVAGLAVFFGLYALHFLFVPAAMRANFFDVLLPSMLAGYSSYGSASTLREYLEIGAGWLVLIALLGFAARPNRRDESHELARALAVLTLGTLAVYLVQGKGWLYQAIPAQTSAFILGALLLLRRRAVSGRHFRQRRLLTGGLYAALLFWMTITPAVHVVWYSYPNGYNDVERFILDHTAAETQVMIISTAVSHQSMLLRTNRHSSETYPIDYPIAFAFNDREAVDDAFFESPPLPPAAAEYLQAVADDIAEQSPALIGIDGLPTCNACPEHFQLIRYLDAVGFLDEVILPRYELVGGVGAYYFYRLRADNS